MTVGIILSGIRDRVKKLENVFADMETPEEILGYAAVFLGYFCGELAIPTLERVMTERQSDDFLTHNVITALKSGEGIYIYDRDIY